MSAAAAATDKSPAAGERKRSGNQRRRRPSGPRGPRKAPADGSAAAGKESTEAAPRAPRQASVPVPDSMIGTTTTGVVSSTFKRYKNAYGFIAIGEGESAPSIYFNFADLSEDNQGLRKGYEVEFQCTKDERDRSVAKNIVLTEKGKAAKAAWEADYETRKKERAASAPATAAADASAPSAEEKKPRTRKPRAPAPEGTPLTLLVSAHDVSGEKTIEAHNLINIGKLKNLAASALGATGQYSLYHIDASGSKVFLTRSVIEGLSNNSKIFLDEPAKNETA